MSQREKIRKHLRSGKRITALSAFALFGCLRLSERIRELEAEGLKIKRSRVSIDNGCGGKRSVVVYRV